MKKVKFTFLLLLLMLAGQVFTYSSGPPAANTNAPGETACGGCHGTATTSGTDWSSMSLTTTTSLAALQPNTTYPITLSFTSSTSNRIGFMLCALPASATSSTGSLGTIGVSNSAQTQTTTSGNRTYLEHTFNGTATSTGTKTWTFNFTTPSSYNGGATFYVCVNATDGDNSSSGDEVFAKTFSANVLPLKWLDLIAEKTDGGYSVRWSTAMEVNTSYFEVERSENNRSFESLGRVGAAGNSTQIHHYSFFDKDPVGNTAYYRIKQVDRDGQYAYSSIFKAPGTETELTPELAYNSDEKLLFVKGSELKSLELFNLQGELIKRFESTPGNRFLVDDIPSGVYLIRPNGQTKSTRKLFIP